MKRPASIAVSRSAVLVALALLLAACASAREPALAGGDVERRVADARTPEQHLGLVSYFEAQATAAQQEADECRKLRKYYERTPQSLYYTLGMAPAMLSHYDQLIQNHERNAGE